MSWTMICFKGLWSGKVFHKKYLEEREKENLAFCVFFFTIFISFNRSVIVLSGLVIATADSYVLQQFVRLFPCTPLHNRIKISNFVSPEMIKACPLMKNLRNKNSLVSFWSIYGPFESSAKCKHHCGSDLHLNNYFRFVVKNNHIFYMSHFFFLLS